MPAFKLDFKRNRLRKMWQITGKRWISSAVYRGTRENAYHDRYQIEEIFHDVYHCMYEISGILPESVSLYTLKRQFISDITQCAHTFRKGASSRVLYHLTTVKTRKKLRFRWQASAKCTIFAAFGCTPNPICRLRAEKGAARIDIPCDSNFQIQQRRNCHRNKTPYAL